MQNKYSKLNILFIPNTYASILLLFSKQTSLKTCSHLPSSLPPFRFLHLSPTMHLLFQTLLVKAKAGINSLAWLCFIAGLRKHTAPTWVLSQFFFIKRANDLQCSYTVTDTSTQIHCVPGPQRLAHYTHLTSLLPHCKLVLTYKIQPLLLYCSFA